MHFLLDTMVPCRPFGIAPLGAIANHEHFVSLYRAKVRELGNATVARFDQETA